MKKIKQITKAVLTALLLASCAVKVHSTSNKPMPPGQAKKVRGSKSAKHYAPGQVKKETGSKSAQPYAPGQKKKHGNKRHR